MDYRISGSSSMPSDVEGYSNWPCCGVASVAMLAEVDFKTAWEACAKTQSTTDPNHWKGSTRWLDREKALEDLGLVTKTVEAYSYFNCKRKSLKVAIKQGWFDTDTVYMVRTKGHAQIVYNGLIYDQSYPNGIDPNKSWQGRKIVDLITTAKKAVEPKQEENDQEIWVEIVIGNKSWGWEPALLRGYTPKGRIKVIHRGKNKAFDPKRVSNKMPGKIPGRLYNRGIK